MAKFGVNQQRFDPYRNFRFKVKFGSEYVAGLSKCGALKKTTETVEWREAGESATSHILPGKTSYDAITLEAGLTHDTAFEEWANLVNNYQGDGATSPRNFRRDIAIEVYNEAGQKVLAYKVHRCWVSEYQALPELDAAGNAVAIQTITIQNEGWERDTGTSEPSEP